MCIGFDEGRKTYKVPGFKTGPLRAFWKLASVAFKSSYWCPADVCMGLMHASCMRAAGRRLITSPLIFAA